MSQERGEEWGMENSKELEDSEQEQEVRTRSGNILDRWEDGYQVKWKLDSMCLKTRNAVLWPPPEPFHTIHGTHIQ